MPCRAKISVLIGLLGVASAHGAMLSREVKATAFQPGAHPARSKVTVIKPAEVAAPIVGDLKKIAPALQPAAKVQVGEFSFHRAPEAPAKFAKETKPAGGRQ